MRTKKHVCEFTRSTPSASVDTCYCGKFRHNENNKNEPIVAIERDANEGKHTPTPWFVKEGSDGQSIRSTGTGLNHVRTLSVENGKADASFIVRAVNSHEELLEAAKRALDGVQRDIAANPMAKTDRPEIEAMLRQAIAKVEGK